MSLHTNYQFTATGTLWQIDLDTEHSSGLNQIEKEIGAMIEQYESELSRFRENSVVRSLSGKTGTFPIPESVGHLLQLSQKLYDVTNGAMSPIIGGQLNQAGYDSSYSFKPKDLSPLPLFSDVIRWESDKSITIEKPVEFDFGACAKGYIVDRVGDLLKKQGITSGIVDAGGDMLVFGQNKPVRIGLEDPQNERRVIGYAEFPEGALCGSAGNRRRWHPQWHHIINPHQRKSPDHVIASWVYAQDTMTADALATALFLGDAIRLQEQYTFSYVLLKQDYRVEMDKRFPGRVF
jgi:thiamine biosynthesis lipoprotein